MALRGAPAARLPGRVALRLPLGRRAGRRRALPARGQHPAGHDPAEPGARAGQAIAASSYAELVQSDRSTRRYEREGRARIAGQGAGAARPRAPKRARLARASRQPRRRCSTRCRSRPSTARRIGDLVLFLLIAAWRSSRAVIAGAVPQMIGIALGEGVGRRRLRGAADRDHGRSTHMDRLHGL